MSGIFLLKIRCNGAYILNNNDDNFIKINSACQLCKLVVAWNTIVLELDINKKQRETKFLVNDKV